jgi:AcrR family transcriptional regulator
VQETSGATDVGRMRADARLNRARILDAARDVFVEQGPDAPLPEVSRRAGTGIATLYRRFPDRQALMRAVALDALTRTTEEAHRAVDEEPEPFAALARYMHRALDTRIGAVIPVLLEAISLDDDELLRARDRSTRIVHGLVDAAHGAGTLRSDATFGDISMIIVRLSRPLPGGFTRELNDQLAHRHLELVLAGLRPAPAGELPGPALTLEDLRGLPTPPRAGDPDMTQPSASRSGSELGPVPT